MITDQEVEEYNALGVGLFKKYEIYRSNNKNDFESVNFPILLAISQFCLAPKYDYNKKKMIDIASRLNSSNTFAISTVISDFEFGDLNKDIKPYVYHVRINSKDDENEKENIVRTANEWARLKSDGLIKEILKKSDIEPFFPNKSENIQLLIKTLSNYNRCNPFYKEFDSLEKLLEFLLSGKDQSHNVSLSDYGKDENIFIANIPYTFKPGSMIICQPQYRITRRKDFIDFLEKLEVPGEFDKFLKSFDKDNTLSIDTPTFVMACDCEDLSRFICEEMSFQNFDIFEKDIDLKETSFHPPLNCTKKDPNLECLSSLIKIDERIQYDKPFLFFVLDGSNCIIDAGIFVYEDEGDKRLKRLEANCIVDAEISVS